MGRPPSSRAPLASPRRPMNFRSMPTAPPRAAFGRILRLARPELWSLAAGTAFLAIGSGATLLIPHYIGFIVDQATAIPAPRVSLDEAAVSLVAIALVMAIATAARF